MEEKDLIEKLSDAKFADIEPAGFRTNLRRDLLSFASKEKLKQPNHLKLKSLRWQTILAGLLVVVVIAALAVSLPMLTGHDKPVSAAEVALASPQIQAALGGLTPGQMNTTDKINTAGDSRVVITSSLEDQVIIAYVDPLNHQLVSAVVANIIPQDAADASDLRALDIVNSDSDMKPQLQGLLSEGLQLYFMQFTVIYPDTINDPQSITGLPVVLFLKDQESAKYYFLVDLNSGLVSGGGSPDAEPLPTGGHAEFFETNGQLSNDDIAAVLNQIHDLSK